MSIVNRSRMAELILEKILNHVDDDCGCEVKGNGCNRCSVWNIETEETDFPDEVRNHIERLGVKLNYERRGFCWDGYDLSMYGMTELGVDLIHDLAHFQIVPEERLRAIDFGLGKGPRSSNERPVNYGVFFYQHDRHLLVTQEESEKEENYANMLGVITEYCLNLTPQHTLEFTDALRHPDLIDDVKFLFDNGYIDLVDDEIVLTYKVNHSYSSLSD